MEKENWAEVLLWHKPRLKVREEGLRGISGRDHLVWCEQESRRGGACPEGGVAHQGEEERYVSDFG